jgi:hypothetical protein
VAKDLQRVIEGEVTSHASAACLSFHGPSWCTARGRPAQTLLRSA